jgi:hypothetical protein
MKKIKTFQSFINEAFNRNYNCKLYEKYGETMQFYHLTNLENLKKFKNGIDIKIASIRGQGDGFYVLNNLNSLKGWTINVGEIAIHGTKKTDCIIEIEAILNETNFDLDYELVKNLEHLIIQVIKKSGKKQFDITHNNEKFTIITDENLSVDDFTVSVIEIDGAGAFIPECTKHNKWAFFMHNFKQTPESVGVIKYMINTFDNIGLKNEIEKLCFQDITKQDIALRYVGKPIMPSRYMYIENNKWSDWKIYNPKDY